MGEWIRLEDGKYNPPRKEVLRGVEVNVFMSPYDVPRAIHGEFDKASKRFKIKFQYIGDEVTTQKKVDSHVCVHVGKNSSRLYGIDVDVIGLDVQAVGLQIFNAIAGLRSKPPKFRRDNYSAAAEAIEDSKDKLFAIAT